MNVQMPALNLQLDDRDIQRQIREKAQSLISDRLFLYFHPGRKVNGKMQEPAGIGADFINTEIDKLLLELEENGQLKKLIREQFSVALNKAIEHAAQHAANKAVFTEVK